MFRKKKEELDKENLNEVILLSKKTLKILVYLLIIVAVYASTLIWKEWKIYHFLLTVLKILSPFFIGLLIAWLFDPFVSYLQKKGIRRGIGTCITYILLLGSIYIVIRMIFPMLASQINEFAKTIPILFDNIQKWLDGILNKIQIKGFDTVHFKNEIFAHIETFATELTTDLPSTIVTFISNFMSGLGVFLVGLIIGFYLLLGFHKIDFSSYVPSRYKKDAKALIYEMNTSLRSYVQGAILDCTAIFLVTSLGLSFTGLQAPLLFGLFCGITNIIPYAGPYIGGAPAVIVGFAQSPTIGLFTLIVIAVIQFTEGNFIQPFIMSKTTKLHPVTIIVGLLLFGYFWGIVGMLVSTPIIAVVKTIFLYFNEKYGIIKEYQESEEKD